MGSGYRPPPPDKIGRSDLVRIERARKRTVILAVIGSVLVFFLAINVMTRFTKSWSAVTLMALRALGKEPQQGKGQPEPPVAVPSPRPAPVEPPGSIVPGSPMPVWRGSEGARFYWVEVEAPEPGRALPAEIWTPDTARRSVGTPSDDMEGVCPFALDPEDGDPIESSSMETVGGLRFLGMCGGSYAYELVNRSGGVLNALFTDNQGQAWQVLTPPGASSRIKSRTPLDPGLIGRPMGQAPVGSAQ